LKKATVINLGCPKNQVDSEVITGLLANTYMMTTDPLEAHIIIVNTCGFIEDAKAESIEVICEMAELKKTGSCEKIFATGCLAQRYGKELLKELPELDGVLGDGNLEKIAGAIEESVHQRVYRNKKVQDFLYSHDMPRIRSVIIFRLCEIAEGCDNCCSYCAIPNIKGRYRSRMIESIVEETGRLAREGVKEIVLVAQDTTRYGIDLYGAYVLPDLLEKSSRLRVFNGSG
jgi:ribosomal protein S12 methylthiotransferase